MRVRKVDAEILEPKPDAARPIGPREARRRRLEDSLETVIRKAAGDPASAYRVTLLPGESLPGVRTAFKRARGRAGADEVNLVTVAGQLYIAATPQRRGRRPKAPAPSA